MYLRHDNLELNYKPWFCLMLVKTKQFDRLVDHLSFLPPLFSISSSSPFFLFASFHFPSSFCIPFSALLLLRPPPPLLPSTLLLLLILLLLLLFFYPLLSSSSSSSLTSSFSPFLIIPLHVIVSLVLPHPPPPLPPPPPPLASLWEGWLPEGVGQHYFLVLA